MKANSKMNYIIKNTFLSEESDNNISLRNLLRLLQPNIKNIYDCLIIDNENEIEIEKIDIDKILQIYGDRTGYEASCNEIRINDYINGENIDFRKVLDLGFKTLDIWCNILKKDYPYNEFCLIISCDKESVTLRFHKVRHNESMWLSENLEGYEEAVAFKII